MRPFASTPAARTKDSVIWSFNGQNYSFYHLNWINVRRSQKNGMLFFIQNVKKNGNTVFLHNGEWKDPLFNLQQQLCHAKRVQLKKTS
jgi:hypothetical protein